jgi:hypothetical protein
MASPQRASQHRRDPAHLPMATRGELQAVQLERHALVETSRGRVQAFAGQWLVTEPDGTVRVLTDEAFRWQMLHHQLSQLVVRNRRNRRAKA